jgi:hypothetical protein
MNFSAEGYRDLTANSAEWFNGYCQLTAARGTFQLSSLPSTIMWKWLGGCLVIVVVVIAIGVWTGYRKLSQFSGPNKPETVAIAAPASRVFASVANADSLS